jgi:ankyrin repeat protein
MGRNISLCAGTTFVSLATILGCHRSFDVQKFLDAAKRDDTTTIHAMLGAGMDPNATGEADITNARGRRFYSKNETALHVAAFYGSRMAAGILLAAGADPNARNSAGNTPLHSAATGDRPDLAALLIDAGSDVNAVDEGGFTPLMNAALLCATSVLPVLIENDAKVNWQNPMGIGALGVALLAGLEPGDFPLMDSRLSAVQRAHIKKHLDPKRLVVIKMLLGSNADPNLGGITCPSMFAASLGDVAALRLLLTKVHDVNARHGGATLLGMAVASGDLDTVKLLVRYGADASAAAPDGTTPISAAIDPEIRKFLLKQ